MDEHVRIWTKTQSLETFPDYFFVGLLPQLEAVNEQAYETLSTSDYGLRLQELQSYLQGKLNTVMRICKRLSYEDESLITDEKFQKIEESLATANSAVAGIDVFGQPPSLLNAEQRSTLEQNIQACQQQLVQLNSFISREQAKTTNEVIVR